MQTGPYCIEVSFVIYTIIVEQTVAIVTKRLSHTQKNDKSSEIYCQDMRRHFNKPKMTA